MAKMLVAFMIGLAVAALGLSLLDRYPASVFEQSGTAPSHQTVETTGPSAEGGSPNAMPNEFATDSEAGEIEGPVEIEESVDERSANERPPPEQPIHLSPEFDWLAKNPAHDLIQREPYDVNWAPAMEAHFPRFLRENPELIQTYGYPTSIVCRTSMCELLFVAYGLDAKLDAEQLEGSALGHVVLSDFAESISNSEFFERSEFEEFRTANPFDSGFLVLGSQHTENSVTTIVWWLQSEERLNHPGGAFAVTDERRRAVEERRKAADPPPALTR